MFHLRISQQPPRLFTNYLVTPTCDSVSLMRLSLPHTWMLEKGASCLISPLSQTQAAFWAGSSLEAPFLWRAGAAATGGSGQERVGHHLSFGGRHRR